MDSLRSRFFKWAIPMLTAAAAYFWYRCHKINASELKQSDPGGDVEETRENCISSCITVPLLLSMQNLSLDNVQQEDMMDEEQRVSPEGQHVAQEESVANEQLYISAGHRPAKQQFMSEGQQYLMSTQQYIMRGQQFGPGQYAAQQYGLPPGQFVAYGQQYGLPAIRFIPHRQQYGVPPQQFIPQGQQYGMPVEQFFAQEQRYAVPAQQFIAQEQQYIPGPQYVPSEQHVLPEIASKQQYMEYTENNTEQASPTGNIQAVEHEADSGNPSPRSMGGDPQVAGPSDETRSEGSLDSGKGSFMEKKETYDFVVPQHLVGRLIGRNGNFLHSIREKTNIAIYVHDHPTDCSQKVCSMQGSADGIATALKMIRQKFPERKFLEITLERVSMDVNTIMGFLRYKVLSYAPLSLIPGINNEISLSHIVRPNWFFANNVTHPTYIRLRPMEDNMMLYYSQNILATNNANVNDFVAAFWNNKWVRGSIKKINLESQKYLIKLLDHGGFWVFESHEIKPLSVEFHYLPFQAIEIHLANIKPKNGVWQKEAYDLIALICKTSGIAQAQIAGYVGDKVYVHIYYSFQNKGVFSLADELIVRGFAEYATWAEIQPEEELDFTIREL